MHEKRVRKGLKLSALACILVFVMGMTAFAAHQIPDITKDGEGIISVDMQDESGDPIPGGEMAIYQVAEMKQVNGNYYFYVIEPFTGIDEKVKAEIDGQNPDHFSDALWRELAQEFADYVADPANSVTPLDKDGTIGEDGNVTFSELNFGLYLLVQTEPAPGYYAATPFLVSIPKYEGTEEEGEYSYKVDAFPKTELTPAPEKKVYTDGNTDGEDDDDGVSVEVGQELTYTISYTNGHALSATVVITDTLDENVEYVADSASAPTSDQGEEYEYEVEYNEEDHTLTWTIKEVKARDSGEVTFKVTVLESAQEPEDGEDIGRVKNDAKVKVGNDSEVDTNIVWNPVPSKDVDVNPDDGLDYGDDGVLVGVGQILKYKISYQNGLYQGDVVITDTLDPNVKYVSGSAEPSADFEEDESGETGGTLTWTLKDLEPEESGYVTFEVEVLNTAPEVGKIDNKAIVKVGNDSEVETNEIHNPLPKKDVDVDPDDGLDYGDDGEAIEIGDTLIYKIDYENTLDEEATITITDVLDERVDYVSSDPEGDISTDDDGNTVITWTIENVAPGDSDSVTFTAIVNDKALEVNEIENTAKVRVGDDNSFVDTNTVHNPRREYFMIDEEIVTDTDDVFHYTDGGWIKDESVTEYYDIEMEMTTLLPVIEGEELVDAGFTMNFHEFLDDDLILDTDTAHFTVYLRGNTSSPINLNDEEYLDENGDPKYYYIEFPTEECTYPGEEPNLCAFHVIVDLSALYEDGIIEDSDLLGDTWITIFFHADLEEDADGDALYGSYTSTVWYEVWSGDQAVLEHTSNPSVVTVYTYEISIIKYNSARLRNDDYAAAAVSGATLGIYTDADCTIPVTRKGENYTVTSGSDGSIVFFGLAGGTYYVKEVTAPSGYILSSTVLTVNLRSLDDEVYVYEGTYANRPRSGGGSGGGGGGSSGGSGGGSGSGGPGDGGSSGEGDSVWDLLPLPQTGQGWAMFIAVCAMIVAGIGLIVAHVVKRKD